MSADATWQVGQYLVGEVIRRGGMSMVFKAYQPALDRYVALKVLPYTDDPTVVARFKLEARSIAQLEHPNVVPIYEYGEHDGHLYIAMQYVAGGRSLVDAIDRSMDPARAIRLIVGVLTGLGFAHEHGIVHRDVKPANVLLPYPVWPMLTDFGVAKVVTGQQGRRLTQEGLIIGTPAYMAPEQAFALPVDGRTDLYAAGVVLYEMLTGEVPFVARSPAEALEMHAYTPAPAPSTRNAALDPRLDVVILRALAKDPAARYQCAADMVEALEALLHDADAAPGSREVERDLFELGVQAFRDRRWDDAIGHLGQLAAAEPANEDVEALLDLALREHEAAQASASDNDAERDQFVGSDARSDAGVPGAEDAFRTGVAGGSADDTLPGLGALVAGAPPPPGESQLLEPLRPPAAPTLAGRSLPAPPVVARAPEAVAPPASPVPRPPPPAPSVAAAPSVVAPPAVAPLVAATPAAPPPAATPPLVGPPAFPPAPSVPEPPGSPAPAPFPGPVNDVTAALPVRATRGSRVPFVPVAPASGEPVAAPGTSPGPPSWIPTAPPGPPPGTGPVGGGGAGAGRRLRWPWGVAALAAVAVVVVAAVALGGGSDEPGTDGSATTDAAPTSTAGVTTSEPAGSTTTQGSVPSTTAATTGATAPVLPASVAPVFEQALGLAAADVATVHSAAVIDPAGDQQDGSTGDPRPDADPSSDIVESGRFVLSLDDPAAAGATARWPEIPGLLVVSGAEPLAAGDYAVVWGRHAAAVVTDTSTQVISILRIDRPDVPDVDASGVVDAGPLLGDYWIVFACGPDPCTVRSILPTLEFRSGTTGAHVLVHGDLVAFVVPLAEAAGDSALESSSRPGVDGSAAAVFDLATTPGAETVDRYAPAP
jgi:hypothetical protein